MLEHLVSGGKCRRNKMAVACGSGALSSQVSPDELVGFFQTGSTQTCAEDEASQPQEDEASQPQEDPSAEMGSSASTNPLSGQLKPTNQLSGQGTSTNQLYASDAASANQTSSPATSFCQMSWPDSSVDKVDESVTNSSGPTTAESNQKCELAKMTGSSGKVQPQVLVEVAVQVNDYDIERRSGRLPARRRLIPFKFRDYKNPDNTDDDSSDSDYEPESETRLPRRRIAGQRGPGRPRKQVPKEEGVKGTEETVAGAKQEKLVGNSSKAVIIKTAKGFKCGICAKVFTQKGNLVVHHRIHTGIKPYPCDFEGCSKTFRSNESLRRHRLAHLGIKPYECSVCGSKFSSRLARQEHMTRHSDEKPLRCDVCERSFRQISCLKRHQITHTHDTPFECGVCQRMFSQKTYLKSHMKVHTGEKPYVCPQCSKAFAHQSDLARHKIVHTGEKPYGCDMCSARFSDASSRRRHVREHLGHKPYSCSLCDETFKRAGQLRVHLSRKHAHGKDGVHLVKQGSSYRQIELSGREDGSVDWMSPENQKKILDLIKNMNPGDPSIVVQQVEISPTQTGRDEVANNRQALLEVEDSNLHITLAERHTRVAGEQVGGVPVEKTVIAITGNGESSASIPLEAYEIIQGLAEESEDQQIFEVHYHSESDVLEDDHPQQLTLVEQSQDATQEDVPEVERLVKLEPLSKQQSEVEKQVGQTHKTLTSSPALKSHSAAESDEHDLTRGHTTGEGHTRSQGQTNIPGRVGGQNQQNLPDHSRGEVGSDDPGDSLETHAIDYVAHPDFDSQEYFNWLSSFTELSKVLPIPLGRPVFQRISQVHKTLTDFMATPSGVISDRENFRVLMCISKDLNSIINEHLSYVLQTMDDDEH